MDLVPHWIIRGDLAMLFTIAACHKLSDLAAFRQTLRDYRMISNAWVTPAATALILAEFGISAGLLFSSDLRAVSIATVTLLCLYSFSIGLNLVRGRREIDCGCLGPSARSPLSYALLVRNAILAFAAGIAALPVAPRSLHPVDAMTIVGGSGAVALIFIASQQLAAQVAILRPRRTAP